MVELIIIFACVKNNQSQNNERFCSFLFVLFTYDPLTNKKKKKHNNYM